MKKLAFAACAFLLSWSVNALELAGVQLADKVQVGGMSLQLNGAGIRTKYFFKIYVGALYLPEKQTSGDAIIAQNREHRMEMHILYGLSSDQLFDGFNEAIAECHTPAELAALDADLKAMRRIFDSIKKVKRGDVIALDYSPASGTHFSVNGMARGTIAGPAFSRALLKIWLGNKPVQDDLRKGLLGG